MIKQIAILFGCLGVGELIVITTGIQLPSSIIGMLLLTLLLYLKWIKLEWVEGIANLLSKNLAFFFIPPGVAVMQHFGLIRESLWVILVSTLVSTTLTLIITGHAYQILRKLYQKKQLKREEKWQ